ncbi:hypothetical protein ABZ424_05980 [Streptomyces sp. NPDC005790]|uniref:hypothetical protein n=1 Tax=Streptomyces sp. NPDC005790 TaxID=3154777 RepID=UPI0033C4FF33
MNQFSESQHEASDTPCTDEAWSLLSTSAIDSIAKYDAYRLAIELEGLAPKIRANISEPLYSMRNLFTSWEHLVRRMESDWRLPGQYPISAYINDLDSRSRLEIDMGKLNDEAQAVLSPLLAELDIRFTRESVPDESGELRPWLNPSSGAEPHGFWLRKPRNHPW